MAKKKQYPILVKEIKKGSFTFKHEIVEDELGELDAFEFYVTKTDGFIVRYPMIPPIVVDRKRKRAIGDRTYKYSEGEYKSAFNEGLTKWRRHPRKGIKPPEKAAPKKNKKK